MQSWQLWDTDAASVSNTTVVDFISSIKVTALLENEGMLYHSISSSREIVDNLGSTESCKFESPKDKFFMYHTTMRSGWVDYITFRCPNHYLPTSPDLTGMFMH